MEALEQLREQAGAAFEDLFTELRTKIAEHNQSSVLDSLRGFAAAVDWRVGAVQLPEQAGAALKLRSMFQVLTLRAVSKLVGCRAGTMDNWPPDRTGAPVPRSAAVA
jgi:uncharacterized protein (DUF1684 family)